MLLVVAGGCAVRAPAPTGPAATGTSQQTPDPAGAPTGTVEPPPHAETDALLGLTAQVVTAATPVARQAIERELQRQFESAPSDDNLLRLTVVRALTAALPAELESVRSDLQGLANSRQALSDAQRHLALLTLVLVENRLTLGHQITELKNQIESLTEIEASLNPPTAEQTP